MKKFLSYLISALLIATTCHASTRVMLLSTATPKQNFGYITFSNSEYGLLVTPSLHHLPAGLHGLHLHINPSCADQGKAAGGHYDPRNTKKHVGPYNTKGHLGDLPALYVFDDSTANTPTLAPRLREADLHAHTIVIHSQGDNYSDQPAKLGGGGPRLGCGIIE